MSRAAVLHGIEDLRVEGRDVADPGPGEVRVRIRAGGICGSDLHYFHHARMGDFPVVEPFVLGHEGAGEVEAIGEGVGEEGNNLAVGDLVAVDPSHPCGTCAYCLAGRPLLCERMRFLGSSRLRPHVQGLFAEAFLTTPKQCVKVPAGTPAGVAACAEPLSVALHAVGHAGALIGQEVLITGSGPIGVLIAAACRLGGAAHITVVDVLAEPLETALKMGADAVVQTTADGPDPLADPSQPRGRFDVAFDASGHPAAVLSAIRNLRPAGCFVQVGTFKDPMVPVPTDLIMTKELTLKSSFRFDKEFRWAVDALVSGRIDTGPLISHSFPLEAAVDAFRTAADRRGAMKVHITF